jgi:hypothetical protein
MFVGGFAQSLQRRMGVEIAEPLALFQYDLGIFGYKC